MKKLILILLFIPLVFSCSGEEFANYTLTVKINPEDGGFVNPDGGTVTEGEQISLAATPADEFIFDSWSGAATGTSTNVSVIMDANKTVTANFIKKKYTLTVNVEGEGDVTQKIIKAGTATDYNSGTIVELTASTNVQGWQFKEWKGDLSGTKNPIEITIDKAKSVTAVFETINVAYLDENGVTIKANNWAKVGDTAEIGGVTYTIVDLDVLKSMIYNEEDVTKVVTSLITDMSNLFEDNGSFDQDISSWDVSNVENMNYMFTNSIFNKDISSWDVSNVKSMNSMFQNRFFNQDIGDWDVSSVTDMMAMFLGSPFNQDIGAWDVSSVENMKFMFRRSSFNQDIGAWDVSSVTDMSNMFWESKNFNQDIGDWDVSSVENMSLMFEESIFNQDIGGWDVSSVKTMERMFNGAKSFNQDIGDWDVSNVQNFEQMFHTASSFNGDISNWKFGKEDMYNISFKYMFAGASVFNQDISTWDVYRVGNMDHMFEYASLFDQDLSKWCVLNIDDTPSNFSLYSALKIANRPVWGTCISRAIIWDGTTTTFTKEDGSDPNQEANQDRITSNVWITRSNEGGQIFNIVWETSPNKTNSPVRTRWAEGSLDEIESLNFRKFRSTVGKPKDAVGKKLVMFLEDDNIYLSVKFKSWSEGKNGGFAYERSTKP